MPNFVVRRCYDRDAMLHWKISHRTGGDTLIKLSGEISEMSQFGGDLATIRGPVSLDCGEIRRINSFGVRALLHFIEALGAHGSVTLENCSPIVVTQLNLLPELTRLVSIRSVRVPLECPRCFHETEEPLDLPRGQRTPPPIRAVCPKCGRDMMLSEPVDRYFAFLEG
jgi:anti-anti-sigma regulatory factor